MVEVAVEPWTDGMEAVISFAGCSLGNARANVDVGVNCGVSDFVADYHIEEAVKGTSWTSVNAFTAIVTICLRLSFVEP